MKRILLVIATILTTCSVTVHAQCEPYEGFRYDHFFRMWYNYVICTNVTLQKDIALPLHYDGIYTTKYIIFKNSNIPIIPERAFSGVRNTREVYLNNSKIHAIHQAAFMEMEQLQELYLQNNNITNIIEGTLYYLSNLKVLDLSNNSLLKLEQHSFSGLRKLERLNLANNRIYELSNCIFCSLTSLKVLDLSYNKIYNIFGNAFGKLFNLEKLLLKNNYLELLPKLLFSNNTMLNSLDLSVNKIPTFNFKDLPANLKCLNISNNAFKSMETWSWLNKLEIIDLGMNDFSYLSGIGRGIVSLYFGGNYLETLDSTMFDQPEDLTCLDVSNTSVAEIKADTFNSLTNLEKLDLSRNQIQNIPVGCFKKLVSLWELRLSHNYLSNLEFGTFAGLENLTVLFLDNNQLSGIHESSFYVLRNLKALYLTNNYIVNLDVGEILFHLPKINTFGLNNNNWTCKSLFNVLEMLTYYHIGFTNGTDGYTENINGIACNSNDKQNNVKEIDGETDKNQFAYLQNNVETIVKEQFPVNSTFQKFFESVYTNSSFFNYFEKGFKKTSFFKYFNRDFFNSSFFQYFDNDFRNSGFFKELNKAIGKNDDTDVSNESGEKDISKESSAEALEFHGNQGTEQELMMFVNKITICVIINVAVLTILIFLFLFILFRKQQKLKFLKSEFAYPQDDALL